MATDQMVFSVCVEILDTYDGKCGVEEHLANFIGGAAYELVSVHYGNNGGNPVASWCSGSYKVDINSC